MPYDDDDSDWSDDSDYGVDDDVVDVVTCPHCSAEIYEDAVRCPVCGDYVTHETSAMWGKPLWYTLLAFAGIIAVIAVLLLMGC